MKNLKHFLINLYYLTLYLISEQPTYKVNLNNNRDMWNFPQSRVKNV